MIFPSIDRSIRLRVMFLMIATTFVALLVTAISLVLYDISYYRKATDLLRGELVRRPHQSAPRDDDEPLPDLVDPADLSPADAAVLATLEDGIRRGLHVALAQAKAWTVAAALSTLTLVVHPDVAVPNGAPEADRWAALWLAGERDAFPDGADRPDDAARRQARSRKLRAVDALLRQVAGAVLGGDADA
jgi:hypothetical protein